VSPRAVGSSAQFRVLYRYNEGFHQRCVDFASSSEHACRSVVNRSEPTALVVRAVTQLPHVVPHVEGHLAVSAQLHIPSCCMDQLSHCTVVSYTTPSLSRRCASVKGALNRCHLSTHAPCGVFIPPIAVAPALSSTVYIAALSALPVLVMLAPYQASCAAQAQMLKTLELA